jgi:hypothetical protein
MLSKIESRIAVLAQYPDTYLPLLLPGVFLLGGETNFFKFGTKEDL